MTHHTYALGALTPPTHFTVRALADVQVGDFVLFDSIWQGELDVVDAAHITHIDAHRDDIVIHFADIGTKYA